jgi:hypothetical protein
MVVMLAFLDGFKERLPEQEGWTFIVQGVPNSAIKFT